MSQAKIILNALNFPLNQYDRTAVATNNVKIVAGSSVLALLLASKNLFFYSSVVPYFAGQEEAFLGTTAATFIFRFLVEHCTDSLQFTPALYFPEEFHSLIELQSLSSMMETQAEIENKKTKVHVLCDKYECTGISDNDDDCAATTTTKTISTLQRKQAAELNFRLVDFSFSLHKLLTETRYFRRSLKTLHLACMLHFPVL